MRLFNLPFVSAVERKRNGPYWCCKSKQQTVLWWFWFTTADPHGWVWSDRAELVMGSKLDVSGTFNILWHVWTSTHIHMTISFWDSYYLGWASLKYSAQVGSFIGWQMFMWICPMRGWLPLSSSCPCLINLVHNSYIAKPGKVWKPVRKRCTQHDYIHRSGPAKTCCIFSVIETRVKKIDFDTVCVFALGTVWMTCTL